MGCCAACKQNWTTNWTHSFPSTQDLLSLHILDGKLFAHNAVQAEWRNRVSLVFSPSEHSHKAAQQTTWILLKSEDYIVSLCVCVRARVHA
jgi:hypothetical protein